jgi:rhodanese-related sulfurtransferase
VESLVKHLSEVVSTITGKKVVDLSPNEVLEQWKQFDEIIDVRRVEELTGELGSIKGVRLSTLQTKFKQDVNTLDKSKRYLFICRSGGRSTKAAQMAIAKGVEQVFNLDGGMLAWRKQDL